MKRMEKEIFVLLGEDAAQPDSLVRRQSTIIPLKRPSISEDVVNRHIRSGSLNAII